MKSYRLLGLVCLTLVILVSGTAWAGDQPASSSNETPAILAALDASGVTMLDDQTAMAIRGQDFPYSYVLVKVIGLNALDYGYGIQWTWNPLGFRYGAFGGPGWSHPGTTPADDMDALFEQHDNGDLSDAGLLAQLLALPNTWSPFWRSYIYVASPTDLETPFVQVSGVSFIGNRFFFGWHPMPYTEYARREALTGIGILVGVESLFP